MVEQGSPTSANERFDKLLWSAFTEFPALQRITTFTNDSMVDARLEFAGAKIGAGNARPPGSAGRRPVGCGGPPHPSFF